MKKENRQLARERRAEQRRKDERKRTVIKILTYWGPIVLVAVVVVVLIVAIATSDRTSSGESADDAGDSDNSFVIESTETGDDHTAEGADGTVEQTADDAAEQTDDAADTEAGSTLNTDEGTVARDGDTVNIDFTGYLDGEAFDGGSTGGAGYDLELGSGSFIDGFEEGIVGHSVGETFDLNLTFPDPYPNDPSLAGKDVVFTTTLNGVYE